MSGKQLSGIKSMHVNSLACVRVKGGENGVRQVCIMPLGSLIYIWTS